jgi:hypothetical protein
VVRKSRIAAEPGQPGPAAGDGSHKLGLFVVFTNPEDTLTALRSLSALVEGLDARITILAAQIVPYPLPLERPPVATASLESCLRAMASQLDTEIGVNIFLCRDRQEALLGALKPGSVVVIGGKRRWWRTADQTLARTLAHHGHRVIFVDTGAGPKGRTKQLEMASLSVWR